MKKNFIIAIIAIASVTAGMAQKMTYFNISEKDAGSPILTVPFDQKPIVSYYFNEASATNFLVVNFNDYADEVMFNLSKNYDITYTTNDTPTAIKDIVASKSSVNYNGHTAILSRLEAGAQVTVFDASGKQYVKTSADSNGIAAIDISHLPSGAVIIKAGKSTFKLRK